MSEINQPVENPPARKRVTLRLSITVPESWDKAQSAAYVQHFFGEDMAPYAKVLQED